MKATFYFCHMVKIIKHKKNIVFYVLFFIVLIIPQSRKAIQVVLHKGISYINPVDTIEKDERTIFKNYDLVLYDETGKKFTLSTAKDKVVLINFWATWCPPCIAEMPSLQKLYDKYKNDVVFLFITSDNMEVVSEFKAKRSYAFPVYNAPKEFFEAFEISSIPRTFVIDKQGEIVIDKSGAVDWYKDSVRKELTKLVKQSI